MSTDVRRPAVLISGLAFPEGPRWHDGAFWFSDMHDHRVVRVDETGEAGTVVEVPNRPSGLGWRPDGTLLVVSMTDRRVLAWDGTALTEVADLTAFAAGDLNDMVVDADGRAYVGNFGFDLHAREAPRPASLVLVDPEGTSRVVADDLMFPNGMVITDDGRTLFVAESMASRITAFDVASDGSLSGRREVARLEAGLPDGICLDAEGCLWAASPVTGEVLRLGADGSVPERLEVDGQPLACMLGGRDRRTLYVCVATTLDPDEARARQEGRIEAVTVDVPGAGLP